MTPEDVVQAVCEAAKRELDSVAEGLARIEGKIARPTCGPFGPGGSSAEIGDLMSALAKAQGAMGPVLKTQKNPHFRAFYADLASAVAAARDALSANGIAVMQSVELSDAGMLVCATVLAHGAQWVRTETSVPVAKRDAQGVGSAATYARRYGLLAILGLAPEDDDGQAAAAKPPIKDFALVQEVIDIGKALEAAKSVDEVDALAERIGRLPEAERDTFRKPFSARRKALK